MNGLFIANQNQKPQLKWHKTWDKESEVTTPTHFGSLSLMLRKQKQKNKNRMNPRLHS